MNTCAIVVKSFVLDVCFRDAAEHAQTAATGALQNVRLRAALRLPQSALSYQCQRSAKLVGSPTSKHIRVRSGVGRRSGVWV